MFNFTSVFPLQPYLCFTVLLLLRYFARSLQYHVKVMAPKKKRALIPAKKFAPRKNPSRRAKDSVDDSAKGSVKKSVKKGVKEKDTVKQPKRTKTATPSPAKSSPVKSSGVKSSTAIPAQLEEQLKAINERLGNIETLLNTLNDKSESILTYFADRDNR